MYWILSALDLYFRQEVADFNEEMADLVLILDLDQIARIEKATVKRLLTHPNRHESGHFGLEGGPYPHRHRCAQRGCKDYHRTQHLGHPQVMDPFGLYTSVRASHGRQLDTEAYLLF